MYWTDWGKQAKIEVAGMDGSNRRVFVGGNLSQPNSLAIDYGLRRLYWSDSDLKHIEYVDLIGSHREVLLVMVIYTKLNIA
jgi:sugar lactone lactonase YvrE